MIFAGIADDVTGGMELAAVLTGQGVDCGFVTNPDLVDSRREAVVIALKTRTVSSADAVSRFAEGVSGARKAGATRVFFKYCATFDSTKEGNIGPCADLLTSTLGVDFTLFAPSFPEAERYVFQGHLFVGDRLVSESPKRFDPLTPMTDPDLVRVLQSQTQAKVGLLARKALRQGVSAAAKAIDLMRGSGIRYAIADAISDEDLVQLAELTADWPLMTGNSTIAGFYPQVWRARGVLSGKASAPALPPIEGPAVVLAGSCAERTIEQLALFARERPVLWIDPLQARREDLAPALFEQAMQLLPDGPVAIASSASPEKVKEAQNVLGVDAAGRLVENVLGRLAVALRDAGVRRFLVAGGETSGAVLAHLKVESLRVGRYESAGVGRAVSEDDQPIALCLKSGKLGPPDMFLPVLESMRLGGA